MRKLLMVAAVTLFTCGVLAQAQLPVVVFADQKLPPVRSLQGLVLNSDEAPLPDAIVYLKNTKTMSVKTFIAEKDGSYRFNALSPNVDYEVYAEYKGKRSGTKTLSAFDSRKQVTVNLKVDTK